MTMNNVIGSDEALEVLRSASLSQVVRKEIERILLSGALKQGEKLNEKSLADQFGVSRGPVREAFQALHARGLVEMVPNRGVFVQRITRHDAVAIYDVRAGLFGAACRILSDLITSDEIAALNDLIAQMEIAGRRRDLTAYFPLNIAFHTAVVAGTRNDPLAETYSGLVSRLQIFRSRGLVHGGGFESSNVEHRRIVAALDARDPLASFEAGWAHVQAGKARMLSLYDSEAENR
jgi:DNA-binding GntR family transcriptional regulator